MNIPGGNDYIDIHTHDAKPAPGIFSIENLMAHESKVPCDLPGLGYTIGIHPWHLNENNHHELLTSVMMNALHPSVAAIGEAGFDRIRGPSNDLQRRTFEEQVRIAEEYRFPVVIHCVKAWEDLLMEYKAKAKNALVNTRVQRKQRACSTTYFKGNVSFILVRFCSQT